MKICYKCKIEKPLNHFGRVAKNKDGHSGWCKECYSEYHKEWFKNSDRKPPEDLNYGLNGVTKSDYLVMYEFMESMGYNPNEDISKQFCDKYGLKYKKRRTKDINRFTYEELKKPPN